MITFEEVTKTVLDLVLEVRRLSEENKLLKEEFLKAKNEAGKKAAEEK